MALFCVSPGSASDMTACQVHKPSSSLPQGVAGPSAHSTTKPMTDAVQKRELRLMKNRWERSNYTHTQANESATATETISYILVSAGEAKLHRRKSKTGANSPSCCELREMIDPVVMCTLNRAESSSQHLMSWDQELTNEDILFIWEQCLCCKAVPTQCADGIFTKKRKILSLYVSIKKKKKVLASVFLQLSKVNISVSLGRSRLAPLFSLLALPTV